MSEVQRVLQDALTQAATAHGEYEKEELGGVHDEDWPLWYAEHMAETLANGGYSLTCW